MHMRILTVAALMAFSCFLAQAGDIYVNEKSTSATEDGSFENPYKTIQAAVNAANADSTYNFTAGDAIKVLPGEYKTGSTNYTETISKVDYTQAFRVALLVKKLRIVTTGSASDTFIIGQRDTSSATGIGPNGICGIVIGKNAKGSIIRGFTIRDCAYTTQVEFGGRGAALNSQDVGNYLADCQIINCSGVGAIGKCTAIRCGFFNNYNWSSSRGMVSREAYLLYCVLSGNKGFGSVISMGIIVNCTIVNNGSQTITSSSGIYNNVLVNNGSTSTLAKYGSNPMQEANNVIAAGYHVCSPATGDYRIASDSPAVSGGDGSYVNTKITGIPSELEPLKDYAGNTVPTSGTIACGAIQGSVARKAGVVKFVSTTNLAGSRGWLDGQQINLPNYASSATYPVIWKFSSEDVGAYRVLAYSRAGLPSVRDAAVTESDIIFAETNGTITVVPPIGMADVVTITQVESSKNVRDLYVDGDSKSATEDGTTENPYKTIQAAIAACTTHGNRIRVRKGTYTGALTIANKTLIVAEEGPEKTTLNANGGVAITANALALVEGLMITNSTGTQCIKGCNSYDILVLRNCLIQDCSATDTLLNYVHLIRSKVLRCSSSRYILDGYRSISSLIGGCTSKGGDNPALVKRNVSHGVFASTFSGNDSPYMIGSETDVFNSILEGGAAQPAVGSGNLVWGLTDETELPAEGFTKGDPQVVDAANGDARLLSTSAAKGLCAVPTAEGPLARAYTLYYQSDLAGNAYDLSKNSDAGCLQNAFVVGSRVSVQIDAKGGVQVEGLPTGTSLVTENTTLTITRDYTSAHCVLGVRVNGTLVPFGDSDTWSMLVTPQTGALTIEVCDYSTCWYVDANIEQDPAKTYDGMTPARAFKTLKPAMENTKLVSGDTVFLLPGVYNDASDVITTDVFNNKKELLGTTRSRVVVPAGVVLAGLGDVGDAAIEGAPHSSTVLRGDEAVRCVYLKGTASVSNLTLRSGYTKAGNQNNAIGCGGGVFAENVIGTYITDCVISNCAAYRGGAVEFGSIRRTLIKTCSAAELGAASALSTLLENCVIDGVSGSCAIHAAAVVRNCTFLNLGDTAAIQGYSTSEGSYLVYNTLIVGNTKNMSTYKNCVFAGAKDVTEASQFCHDCVFTNAAAIALDGYAPAKGDEILIDKANSEYYPATAGDWDCFGNPRVLNDNKLDVGACEYDWRNDFARAIGNRTKGRAATPGVALASKQVVLSDGDVITLGWRQGTAIPAVAKFLFSVTDGSLTVRKNGVVAQVFESGADQSWMFENATAADTVTFSYEGTGSAVFQKSKLGILIIVQ